MELSALSSTLTANIYLPLSAGPFSLVPTGATREARQSRQISSPLYGRNIGGTQSRQAEQGIRLQRKHKDRHEAPHGARQHVDYHHL